jgi:hypothetical protein
LTTTFTNKYLKNNRLARKVYRTICAYTHQTSRTAGDNAMQDSISIPKYFALTVGLIALTGCASIANVPPGTPYKDVAKQFGKPDVSCPAPNGGTRMIWTEEPSGEQAWATVVGGDKLVGPFTQILRPGVFEKLNQGSWTVGQVRCEFGPPARTQTFGDNPDQIVWEYRYFGEGSPGDNYMMLFIYIDKATNKAVKYSTGPDPTLNTMVIGH